MVAIGIDLGTTNSVAAVSEKGQPRVLATRAQQLFTPSVVSFGQGGLVVGQPALHNAVVASRDTVMSVKRLMGRGIDDPEVSARRSHYPFEITAVDDPDDREVRVVINSVRYKPEDVSAMILRQVVEDAAVALGEPVTHAVITVPAYFADVQREATRRAGERAGLVVKKVIDEPTAAAIAFGITRGAEVHKLLVFDMGGGTLDVSVGFMADRQFVGQSLGGDRWLGGDDFDKAIVEAIKEWVRDNYDKNFEGDPRFHMLARLKAEEIKRVLTSEETATVFIPGVVPLPGGAAANVEFTLSRAAFEKRIAGHVERARQSVLDALGAPGLKLGDHGVECDDITTVIPVGGATYVPAVWNMLVGLFGSAKVKRRVDPMQAVALGAAILAEEITGVVCPKRSCGQINDYEARECRACQASLSTARTAGGAEHSEVTERPLGIGIIDSQKNPDAFSVIIAKSTPYPLAEPKWRRYRTTGSQISIPVYAGDKPRASENEYLGLVEYKLPPNAPVKMDVRVTFNYDRNRILTVGMEFDQRPDLNYESAPRRHAPDPSRKGDEQWRIPLRNARELAATVLERYGEFIADDKRKEVAGAQARITNALEQRDAKEGQKQGQEALSHLTQILEDLGPAGRLLMVDRVMHQVAPATAGYLATLAKDLKDALRDENTARVQEIQNTLDLTLRQIAEAIPVGANIGSGGLLEEIETLPESSPAA